MPNPPKVLAHLETDDAEPRRSKPIELIGAYLGIAVFRNPGPFGVRPVPGHVCGERSAYAQCAEVECSEAAHGY